MSGPAWGQNLLTGAQAGFFGNPYVRDYQHAAKTFLPNAYQNSPKLKFLFHTVFEFNQGINIPANIGPTLSVLVKSVKLPGFNIQTQQLNQYNRKRINQTKIQYDPVDITFHDDCGNLISSLWYNYYTYYYKDGQNPQVVFNGSKGAKPNTSNTNSGGAISGANGINYNTRDQYTNVNAGTGYVNWGYNSQGIPNNNPTVKIPFFKNITVFGINRHNFISYTLINPVITRFGHDTYDYDQGNGVMTNQMTLDYETVVYNQGAIDGKNPGSIVPYFGDPSVYDRTTSPIQAPGANAKIIGQGGLIDAAGGAITDLANGPMGILKAVQTAGTAYNTIKSSNIAAIATTQLTQAATSFITQAMTGTLGSTNNSTRNTSWEIPVYGQTGSTTGTAGTPGTGQSQSGPVNGSNSPTAGTQQPNPATGSNSLLGSAQSFYNTLNSLVK
jgi:hypothetical protein